MTGERIFSSRDLSDKEVDEVRFVWGRPHPSPNVVREFMEIGGQPLLRSNDMLLGYMSAAKVNILEALDLPPGDAVKAFNRGALLYAGVYQFVNRANVLQVSAQAINRLADLETVDFILGGREQIIEGEPNFYGLLETAWPAITSDKGLREVAVLGAGAVHLAVIETEHIALSPHGLEVAHPELASLADDFDQLSVFDK